MQALSGEPITIYGDGRQTRSFCYVDDLVDGLVRLMESPADFTGPVNLGNPAEFTMRELAELVLEQTRRLVAHDHAAAAAGRPETAATGYPLAKERLGWKPTVALRDGLKPTVAYFRSLIGEA